LLLPDYVLEGWTTTLSSHLDAAKVIALYCDHATHEQFHSEFKTDRDLERLPLQRISHEGCGSTHMIWLGLFKNPGIERRARTEVTDSGECMGHITCGQS